MHILVFWLKIKGRAKFYDSSPVLQYSLRLTQHSQQYRFVQPPFLAQGTPFKHSLGKKITNYSQWVRLWAYVFWKTTWKRSHAVNCFMYSTDYFPCIEHETPHPRAFNRGLYKKTKVWERPLFYNHISNKEGKLENWIPFHKNITKSDNYTLNASFNYWF